MPTQRDVAKLAGVSSASVSRYLANIPSVKPRVVERIRWAIQELNYRVDQSAQTLKTGRSLHLAILAPATGPYFWEISSILQAELDAHGYFCSLLYSRPQTDWNLEGSNIMEVLHRRQMDGAIVFPLDTPQDDRLLAELKAWDKPVVVLDRHVESLELPQVWVDNEAAARQAAREILARGHRDLLFLWGEQSAASAQARWKGFSEELALHGLFLGADRQLDGKFYSHYAWAETKARWDGLPPFTAVFAGNDSSAIGFLRAAKEAGRECPRDYSLVGFDDHAEFAAFFSPALTTFRMPTVELARAGARILLRRLGSNDGPWERETLGAEFVQRESLAPLKA